MTSLNDFLAQIKTFLTGFILRWVLKIGGAYFATIGVETGTIEEIVGGLVAIIVGVVISLFQHNKAVKTPTD